MAKHSEGPQFWLEVRLQEAVFEVRSYLPALPQLSCKLPTWLTPKLMATTATTTLLAQRASLLMSEKGWDLQPRPGMPVAGQFTEAAVGHWSQCGLTPDLPPGCSSRNQVQGPRSWRHRAQCRDPTHQLNSAFWDWSLELSSPTFSLSRKCNFYI